MKKFVMITLAMLVAALPAAAEMVTVEFFGEVEYSQINSGVWADVAPGDQVYAAFYVDSDVFTDSATYNVRGYNVDMSSFILEIGTVPAVGLVDPQPYDATSYFVIRESDPVADGFGFANEIEWFSTVPAVEVPGQIDPWMALRWEVGYEGETLPSLDILDCIGSYDYTGLTSFYTAIQDSWADAMGLIYTEIRISTDIVPTETMSFGDVKSLYR